jgi:hypothetical protein
MAEKSLSSDASPVALMGGGSPKATYTFFLFKLCTQYFEVMLQSDLKAQNIDAATNALVSFCVNREKRQQLWDLYVTERGEDNRNTLAASAKTVGELMSYLGESLELEEEAIGGLM